MKSVFDSLPGVEMPVDDVLKNVADMWGSELSLGSRYAVNRASQLNLVLHFGVETSLPEAEERFQVALQFAQRYPCRVVVLCPFMDQNANEGSTLFRSKLYSVCFLEKSLREQCCCEALILSYPREFPKFLENQLTLWVEADLPIYHWFVKVPSSRIEEYYLGFVAKCRRVIFDSDIDRDDLSLVKWPRPEMAHDLASARLLSVRQSIGQLLSSYESDTVLGNLESIRVGYRSGMKGEANHLQAWLQSCSGLELSKVMTEELESKDLCLEVSFRYHDENKFAWSYSSDQGKAEVKGFFGKSDFQYHVKIKRPNDSDTLSEALFFNS